MIDMDSALNKLLYAKPTGLAMQAAAESNEQPPLLAKQTLFDAVSLSCRFYLCDTAMSYWHPAISQRIEALRKLGDESARCV